ncbi:MAG TPA: hypothetical protein VKT81_11310 [Bryobacteraceae bacterium]|nr:hypothetical protein [Bryobacteraceae bacterium]
MAEQALDLWPKIETTNVRTPLTVLKRQAALLGQHTENLLEARVITLPASEGFQHSFLIVVPTIGYQIELFRIAHDLNLYPVKVDSATVGPTKPLQSEDELVEWLKMVLNSPETKRILNTLMVQAES